MSNRSEGTARNLILVAAIGGPLGIVLSVLDQKYVGAAAVCLSTACALVGLHKFGRSGTDQ